MDNMKRRNSEQEYMRKTALDYIIKQLKLRGENIIRADRLARYDLYIKDKDIKIRVKFCKPTKRCSSSKCCWEFTKVIHVLRLFPKDIFDYYILVGFNDNMVIQKVWKISTGDKLIYRKNQIFIPIDDNDNNNGNNNNDSDNIYKEYELETLEEPSKENFEWIG